MKLFIWVDPVPIVYGKSYYIAVAEDVERAREIAKNAPYYPFMRGAAEPAPTNITLGEPERVHELPCGEWGFWEE